MIVSTQILTEDQKQFLYSMFSDMKSKKLIGNRDTLEEILEEEFIKSFLFYVLDNKIVGACILQYPTMKEIFVRLVYVDVEYRRRGILKSFVEYIWDNYSKDSIFTRTKDIDFISFGVANHNDTMKEALSKFENSLSYVNYIYLFRTKEHYNECRSESI